MKNNSLFNSVVTDNCNDRTTSTYDSGEKGGQHRNMKYCS